MSARDAKDIFESDQRAAALVEIGAMLGKMYTALCNENVPPREAAQIVSSFAMGTAQRLWGQGEKP